MKIRQSPSFIYTQKSKKNVNNDEKDEQNDEIDKFIQKKIKLKGIDLKCANGDSKQTLLTVDQTSKDIDIT